MSMSFVGLCEGAETLIFGPCQGRLFRHTNVMDVYGWYLHQSRTLSYKPNPYPHSRP